ncbi:MAG: glycosyltransferase family 4 protein, partial [Sarcina sp.]
IPEVIANKELLFNPLNYDEFNSKLLNILNDDILRNRLSIEGFERSKNFTWQSTSLNTLNSYKNLIKLGKKNI